MLTIREPGSTPVGEKIREIFKNPPEGTVLTPWSEVFLLSAARHQLVHDRVLPALENGTIVLADRFVDSTFAYQGLVGNLPMEDLQQICRIATCGIRPDRTFLFRAPIDVMEARIRSRQSGSNESSDRFDQSGASLRSALEDAFQHLAGLEPDRIVTVDATRDVETITSFLVGSILELLPSTPA